MADALAQQLVLSALSFREAKLRETYCFSLPLRKTAAITLFVCRERNFIRETLDHGNCGRSRFRHTQCAGFDRRQRTRTAGLGGFGISAASQTRRPRLRDSIP